MNPILELLRADGSIIINKALARNIGNDCAIMFSELISKYNYFKERGTTTNDDYFFNTIEDMQYDTNLTEYQQRKTIKKLVEFGLVETKVKGLPATRYFKICQEESVIAQFLKNLRTRPLKNKEFDTEKLKGNNTNPTILKKDNENGGLSDDKRTSYSTPLYDKEEVREAMKTYLNVYYPQRAKKKHPSLKPQQYKNVYESISDFADEHGLGQEEIEEVMLKHFNNFTVKTDWNINHFATEGIMMNRMYESLGNL